MAHDFGGSGLTTTLPAPLPAWLIALIISPIVGSFLGVLIRRLPVRAPVMLDRSQAISRFVADAAVAAPGSRHSTSPWNWPRSPWPPSLP
jgi:prepilin signal peptidase PulO-like enzyme (type II secretory pathway)